MRSMWGLVVFFFFSSRRRHTRLQGDWSSDVCSSDLGGKNLAKKANDRLEEILKDQDLSRLTLLFSVPYDFPTEWAAFTGSTTDLKLQIRKDFFPYLAQDLPLTVSGVDMYGIKTKKLVKVSPAVP